MLERQIARIATQIDGVVGVDAIDIQTGRRVSVHAQESFPMASVYKFPLAVALLSDVDRGKLRLEQVFTLQPSDFSRGHSPIRENAKGRAVSFSLRRLLEAAVSDSDNSAADFLMTTAGGPHWATGIIQKLGITGLRIDRAENEICSTVATPQGVARYALDPRDTATPAAAARLWELVATSRDGLQPASHRLLLSFLLHSRNPVRIATLLPKGSALAHKTGSMPGTLNDTGAVTSPDGRHTIIMAIFTKASRSREEQRTAVIAQIAKAIYETFTN